jgi:phosphoserine phosphatase
VGRPRPRQCYAYSDSVSDLPMLQAVGHSCGRQPGLEARARRPPARVADLIFSRRTKEVVRRTSQAVGCVPHLQEARSSPG